MKLVTLEPNPKESVLQRLEESREFVNNNAVSGIAIVMMLSDGTMRSCWSEIPNYTMMLGAIERMKRRMTDKCEGGDN